MTLANNTRMQIAEITEQHPYLVPLAGIVVISAISGGIAGAIAGSFAAESVAVGAVPITAARAAKMIRFGVRVVPLLL